MEIISKGINYFNVEKNLQIAINDGKVIRVISYAMSSDVENTLDKIVSSILIKYNKLDLKGLIYTCTKELAINGTKANHKRIFFEEQSLDIHDAKDYIKGTSLFRRVIREENTIKYGKKAKESGLYVRISFTFNRDVIRIEVQNNTGMTHQEEKRLREKLAKTMQYDDLMQYYIENADDTEGAGMGIALIIIMLKGANIDPNLFRLSIKENMTIAKIEIPLSTNFSNPRLL